MGEGDDALLRQLLEVFFAEADEQLAALDKNVLALERSADPAEGDHLIREIFRQAHTLKGSAAAVDLDGVRVLAHRIESLFARMQEGEVVREPSTFDVVYRALDAVRSLVEKAATGVGDPVDLEGMVAVLDATADRHGADETTVEAAGPAGAHGPVAPPGGGPDRVSGAAAPRWLDESVRVSTSTLDALMGCVGDLLVTLTSWDAQFARARALGDTLAEAELLWRRSRALRGSGPAPAPNGTAAGNGARVSHPQLQDLTTLVEEGEAHLKALRRGCDALTRGMRAEGRRMAQVAARLQEEVGNARLLPVARVLEGFPRMMRDLARHQGKEVTLEIGGEDTQVDRAVLEVVKAPLTHLLRNAVDHGIESPGERLAAGKPRQGRVVVEASQHGGRLLLVVADDGAGIDPERVKAAALQAGMLRSEDAARLSDRQALNLIFRSGLSTSATVTDLSGRGVGLDVVRDHVERLNGIIDVESRPGGGTTFTFTLPLTVATRRCILVSAAGQTLALPVTSVLRVVRVGREETRHAGGGRAIRVEGQPVVLARLAEVLGMPPGESSSVSHRPALVVGSAERRAAFLVDAAVDAREVVVKSLPPPLPRVHKAAGATVLSSGEVVVVLNVADLLSSVERLPATAAAWQEPDTPSEPEQPLVLVADDSITTRTLEKNILESAGFRVRVAADGADAWRMLEEEGADLLLTDVMMPRLDGFALTEKVRADDRFRHLPVVLVTSLDSPGNRERGIRTGADAYIVKGAFEQEKLLDTIRRLV